MGFSSPKTGGTWGARRSLLDTFGQEPPREPKRAPRWLKRAPRGSQDAPTGRQDILTEPILGLFRLIQGLSKGQKCAPAQAPCTFLLFYFLPTLGSPWLSLGFSCAFDGLSWSHLGPSWVILGPSPGIRGILDPSWSNLAATQVLNHRARKWAMIIA